MQQAPSQLFRGHPVRRLALALILLGAPSFARAECPQPLTETAVREMAAASKTAIDGDDALAHMQVFTDMQLQLPCLEGQLPKEPWAEILVSEAIVRYTTDKDWRAALNTALAIWPQVPDIPQFVLDEWSAPPSPRPWVQPIPPGTTLFLDGVLVTRPTHLSGLHVAQRLVDGTWQTVLLRDGEQWPASWFEPVLAAGAASTTPAEPEGPKPRSALLFLLGVGNLTQWVDSAGNYLGSGTRTGPIAGLGISGVVPVAGQAGFSFELAAPVQIPSVRTEAMEGGYVVDPTPTILPDAWLGAGAVGRTWSIQLGGGFTSIEVVEGDEPRALWYPQPRLQLEALGDKAELLVGFGGTPSLAHFDFRTAFALSEAKPGKASPRIGGTIHVANAWFDEAEPGFGRTATVLRARLGLVIAVAWGR